MVPDPHCASCNGTFVEKMDNPTDDPRDYQNVLGGIDDDAFGQENFFMTLQSVLRSRPTRPLTPPPPIPSGRSFNPPRRAATTDETFGQRSGGGSRTPRGASSGSPPFSDPLHRAMFGNDDFLPRPSRSSTNAEGRTAHGYFRSGSPGPYEIHINRTRTRDSDSIPAPMMLHYLMSLMSMQPGGNSRAPDFFSGLLPPGSEDGRWGDYVFNQEALDQIISQIMENSSSHPVPATEQVVEKLPREVLEAGSPLLEKDCAVCKDQFSLNTEDPAEQVVVTLPCKHPFHEPCITPWLKSSGTCPVCRHELVPQPHHDHPNLGAPGPSGPTPGPSSSPSPDGGGSGARDGGGGGLFNGLFNLLNTNNSNGQREGSHERPSHQRRGSDWVNAPGGTSRRSGNSGRARSAERRPTSPRGGRDFPGGYHWDTGVD